MPERAASDDPGRGRDDPLIASNGLRGLVHPARIGHYSELLDAVQGAQAADAVWATHWQAFFSHLGPSPQADLDRRARALGRQVRDNGITYNIYADQDGPQRPWSLDLLPFIMTPGCWREIESGVLQRARLCELIMSDVYGEQRLLREAMIPSALVHGHPGYLRAMLTKEKSSSHHHLQIVAFDLVRSPEGRWAVVSQRTQAPSGLGYLLENRLLISSHFPSAFESMAVRPLAPVYQALVASLKNASPAGHRAHVALLTPGPFNETYFEHAYLARHLGLTLVEGHDLTVRDDRLYLRTLGGLEQVDVLLKRLDDEFLDPLELRPDSTLGVPGLLQAIRAGHVIVANAPGSGFLESPGLLGFLPAISEALLDEPLSLPAMDSWWCGEQAALELGLSHLRSSVIKRTYPRSPDRPGFETTLGGQLNESDIREWEGRIRSDPDAFTLQRFIPLSQTPVWQSGEPGRGPSCLHQRSAMLRVFVLRDAAQGWQVLPGGLLRLAGTALEGIASMQRGGSSADVWVQSALPARALDTPERLPCDASEAEPARGLDRRDAWAVVRPRLRLITSRAAENLFWFGRYTERSENTVRLVRLLLDTLGAERPPTVRLWSWLQLLAEQQGLVPHDLKSRTPSTGAMRPGALDPVPANRRRLFERTLLAHLDDGAHVTSVGFNLRAMQQAASVVRERLSIEQWNIITRCVEKFSHDCRMAPGRQALSSVQALQALFDASSALAAITGAQVDRMTRDAGWQLLSLGRHVERLGFLSDALRSAIVQHSLQRPQEDDGAFLGLLMLYDSTITYRAQHQQSRSLAALTDLLVADPENPRSLVWVADSLSKRLDRMSGDQDSRHEERHALTRLIPELSRCRSLPVDRDSGMDVLAGLLDRTRETAWFVSERVSARYFSHVHMMDTSVGS
jgi:uncharacterized circularly permuted ATP-grasp superfamily protein/uncharacterized alpha-E superfamily protein